jgi:hypothetical protein
MPEMFSDFTQFSSVELVHLQQENQAASTALRHEMRTLLNSRLAREINKEEFDLQRKRINDNVLAHKERRTALVDERVTRAYSDIQLPSWLPNSGGGCPAS